MSMYNKICCLCAEGYDAVLYINISSSHALPLRERVFSCVVMIIAYEGVKSNMSAHSGCKSDFKMANLE